jgi:putative addiction module killer protein
MLIDKVLSFNILLFMIVYYNLSGCFKMNDWKIEYWCSNDKDEATVEMFFNQLTDEQFKFVAKEIKLLELCGNMLKLPHSKSIGKGLFELRERRFGYRIYYTFMKNKIIVLLHAGDKSRQRKDIKVARERLAIILEENTDEN